MEKIEIFCPKCHTRIDGFDNFLIQTINEDYVEVEMYCDHCEGVVAFVRIHNDEWTPTVV